MAIYRTPGDVSFKNYGSTAVEEVSPLEWADETEKSRIDEPTWIERYVYESNIIVDLCRQNNYSKILELGSGPGLLGQYILKELPHLSYTYIDKQTSKNIYELRKFEGTAFHVKDLMHSFDIEGLDTDYDFIIANDFLEHIANPSHVLTQARKITVEKASFFISVPNWRMNHEFIYRGLFDYDNFLYFCSIHGWAAEAVFPSILKCKPSYKLSSEETIPDELLDSWNWYFHTKKQQ